MAFSTVIVCCLLIAVASSSPLDERSTDVEDVQLEKEMKRAARSLSTVLDGVFSKLSDKAAEAELVRRSADIQGLEYIVDADANLNRRIPAVTAVPGVIGGRICIRWQCKLFRVCICIEWG